MTEKKKNKCYRCGEIFDEADLIITLRVIPDQPHPIRIDWGIPRWAHYEIKRCPNCKSEHYNLKGHHFESDTIKTKNSKERIFSNSFEELKRSSKNNDGEK